MSSPALEAFLARLYTDAALLAEFLERPQQTAIASNLDAGSVAALLQVDRDALIIAARSFAAKRAAQLPPGAQRRTSWLARWFARNSPAPPG